MHIKEIIIDGFKSYSLKTSISGLDRHFNAITGLNGSGKSNILDAICFVLGITSLSHVRASNLQELIYKYGNAGINKASVTVIFDNKDKKYSPIGCEEYDEVIVSRTIYQGKSKYYLNGYTATQDNIKSLFQSVQLNISNPHFLIMQGKVTQVVNMKPLEILGLLEEAAGTSIYEMKKESSLKTIKKKENKLEEISKLLAEEISPQLEKLMKDKQNYLTWKSRENEISRIFKILTANEYYSQSINYTSRSDEIIQFKIQEEDTQREINRLLTNIEAYTDQITQIEGKYKNQMDKNVKELEMKYKDITHQITSDRHSLENMEKNVTQATKEISKTEEINEKLGIIVENFEKQKKDLNSNLEMFEKDLENKKGFLRELERNFDNVISGKSDGSVEIFNLNKLIGECKSNLSKSKAEKVNLRNQMMFLSEEINKKNLSMKEFQASMKDSKKQYAKIEKEIAMITEELGGLESGKTSSYNPQMIEVIQKSIGQKEIELSRAESKQNEILSRYASRVEVQFRDPESSFDRSKVKGRVIRLITLENERYATALEQVAGGKLFNIIVDTETTSSLLLSRKCFDYGVILIPNNKITAKPISSDKLRLIEQISNGDAKLALDLIKYDKEFAPSMQFVFGSTFVCSTSEIARKLAYNENIKVKCVNLEGDVFDPLGVITGGANFKQQDSILLKVQELNIIQDQIKLMKLNINECKAEQINISNNIKRCEELKNKLEYLNNIKQNLNEESIIKNMKTIENEIRKFDEEIKRNMDRIEQLNEFEKKYNDEIKKLENECNEFKNAGSKTKDVYGKKIKGMKEAIKEVEKNVSQLKKNINDIEFHIEEKNEEIQQNQDMISTEKENMLCAKNEIIALSAKIKSEADASKKIEAELIEKKREITKNETEINGLKTERDKLEKKKEDTLSEMKKIETKILKYEKEIKDSEEKMRKLENENKWIPSEKSFFGMKDTDYDFTTIDSKSEYDKLTKLKEENAVLKRKVNMKVDVMADQYEKEYNDLIKKKEIIIKDKTNIEKAIVELDQKRKDALEDIYAHVNKNLDSIYSTLLPGTKAKLDLMDGRTLMDGLELRVAFNNAWKKSLAELSGGQRSLLALSLILALLLYKPAPIYILDEIDAALDLSHTANLGLMIREHFPQSQFVVVSLKDGMFNNANVLYKVTFVEGSSKVDRIAKEEKNHDKKNLLLNKSAN